MVLVQRMLVDSSMHQDRLVERCPASRRNKALLDNSARLVRSVASPDAKAMSLSLRDMYFLEAKHTAAREIALAIGVPPMLLGIPGDNTYSNMAEANRTFWRQTVLPLVNRSARALAGWLAPAYGAGVLRLGPRPRPGRGAGPRTRSTCGRDWRKRASSPRLKSAQRPATGRRGRVVGLKVEVCPPQVGS